MSSTPVKTLFLKSLVAILALSGLVALVSPDLFPAVPVNQVLLWAALLVLAALALLTVAIMVSAHVQQWVLRRGGTDTSWDWFGAEPAGLEQQRAALKQLDPPQ